MTLFFLA